MQLLQVEVGGIQNYIFEGARLREWRGASALLDRIERRDLPELLEGEPAEIIRSGGGTLILRTTEPLSEEETKALARRAAATYRREAPGALTYSAAVDTESEPTDAISELLGHLSFAAARTRGQHPGIASGAELLDPMARFCDSCGERPAEEHRTLGDTAELVCRACAAKGSHGRKVRRGQAPESLISRFGTFLKGGASDGGPRDDGAPGAWQSIEDVPGLVPGDLTEIGAVDESGEIAVIAADGNRLGATIQMINDLEAYRSFSSGIAALVTESVFSALAALAPPRTPGRGAEARLPWEIIFLGGDDILLVTTADLTVPLTQRICEEVEQRSRALFDRLGLERDFLSMATGIAVADPHVPIGVLRRLAGDLEGRAKDRTYEAAEAGREVSTADFHRLTASGTTTLQSIRSTELRPRRHLEAVEAKLTMRPFTMEELREVTQLARRWLSAGLPGSKVQHLREYLFESPAEATRAWTHVVTRTKSEGARRALQDLMRLGGESAASGSGAADIATQGDGATGGDVVRVRAPWLGTEENVRRTYLLDVIELMELVGAETPAREVSGQTAS